jgi:hypothetical protein
MDKIKTFFKTKLGIALLLALIAAGSTFAAQFGCDVCVEVLNSFKPEPVVVAAE